MSGLQRMSSMHHTAGTGGEGSTGQGLQRMRSETGRRSSLTAKSERRLSIQSNRADPKHNADNVWDLDGFDPSSIQGISKVASGGLGPYLEDAYMFFKGAWHRPSVLFFSFLILASLLFCGIFGVMQAAELTRKGTRDMYQGRAVQLQASLTYVLTQRARRLFSGNPLV